MAASIETQLVVVAIDIGTTYSGYAFSFRNDPCRVQINSAWVAGSDKLLSQKTPTSVLLNPQKKFEAFGYEAENLYCDLSEDNEHHGWYMFRQFKMCLHKQRELNENTTIKDISGKEMPAMTIFTHAIRYLRQHSLTTLKKQKSCIEESDILYVLTVPSIWSDKAKQFMRRAASKAGIPNRYLKIALEPEAASLWGQIDADESGSLLSDTVSKYVIVDLGGGTTDITAHEKTEDGNLIELCIPSGGPWGGTDVDKEYLNFLDKLTGAEAMRHLESKQMADYFNILRDFETNKRNFEPTSKRKITFRLPMCLLSTPGDTKVTLKDKINCSPFKETVSITNANLRVNVSVVEVFFEKNIANICDHLKKLFQKTELQNIDVILLVGGFGGCTIVQNALRQAFPEKKLIIPKETGLTVLKGAVRFGYIPNVIKARKAKYTYGKDNYILFDKDCHPQDKMYYKYDKVWCKDLFYKLVGMGEESPVGNQVLIKTEPLDVSQDNMVITVYYSENTDPKFITDHGCHFIGKIKIELPKGESENDKEVLLKTGFWDTEITVEATVIKTGEKCEAIFDCLL